MSKLNEQYSQVQRLKFQKPTKNKKKPIKVTYISNPTMVRAANASEFRAIVQELTGKDSKIVDTWDPCTTTNEEDTQVAGYETPHLQMESESADDVFFNYTSSLSLEMADGMFWNKVSENFFEFQSRSVFA